MPTLNTFCLLTNNTANFHIRETIVPIYKDDFDFCSNSHALSSLCDIIIDKIEERLASSPAGGEEGDHVLYCDGSLKVLVLLSCLLLSTLAAGIKQLYLT